MIRYLIVFLTIALSACNGKSDKANDELLGIVLIYSTNDTTSLILSKDLLFKEELNGDFGEFFIKPGDSAYIPLNDSQQLIYTYTKQFGSPSDTFLVSRGDTVLIEVNEKVVNNYVLNGTKRPLKKVSNIFPNNAMREQMDALYSVFYTYTKQLLPPDIGASSTKGVEADVPIPNTRNKGIWNDNLAIFIKLSNQYYGQLLDSFSKRNEPEYAIYADLVRLKQFKELAKLNKEVVKDTALANSLFSTVYFNQQNFENRYLQPIFYESKRGLRKELSDQFEHDFNVYTKDIQAYKKYIVIREMVYNKYDRKTIIKYVDIYKEQFGANRFLEEIMTEMEYGVEESEDLDLVSSSKNKTTLQELLVKNKGKVIYVDFWASWCAPCIRALPFSNELKKEFPYVVFVYLALNDKDEPWKRMAEKHNLSQNSYMITNSKSSKFVTRYKINTIPRYMIYDKQGNLANPDAPGPDKEEVKEQLKVLLK